MTTNEHEKFSPDDPRLTAYALGELEGAEHAMVEAALREDAALRAAVADIRATAAQFEGALAGEALPLAPEWKSTPKAETGAIRRAAIIAGGGGYKLDGGPMRAPLIRFPQFYYVVSGLAAACFVVFVLVNDPEPSPAVRSLKKPDGEIGAVSLLMLPAVGDAALTSNKEVTATGSVSKPVAGPPIESRPDSISMRSVPKAVSFGGGANSAGTFDSAVVRLEAFEVKEAVDTRLSGSTLSAAAVQMKDVLGNPIGRTTPPLAPVSREVAEQRDRSSSLSTAANNETYAFSSDNPFFKVDQNPLSTFSADVDTASYANVRRMLRAGRKPPIDAVRVEELVNYFPYRYPAPKNEVFAAALEVADAPWAAGHRLVRIGLKAREVTAAERGAANLVFLVDVSGSMNSPERLPLVKESLRLLVNRLRPDDRVAIVTYAGASGLALASTPVRQGREIAAAIEAMTPGGSTNGGMGIQLAYDIAKANFVTGGVNRVLLCTDGDFNVGVTGEGALVRLVQEKAKSGVFLTVLGYGMGNLKDSMLEAIADKGNGSYGYVDSRREAEKLLGAQVNGTLTTVAKDVKLQVEFNPARVASYRLIGYENRMLAKEDFNNDKVDAGEVGAGHTVTALYEVVPVERAKGEGRGAIGSEDELKYSRPPARVPLAEGSGELLTLKVRFKAPDGDESRKLEFALTDAGKRFADASADFKFAGAVAAFGMVLRDSPHKGTATWDEVVNWAGAGASDDPGGWRGEFVELLRATALLE